MIRRLVALALLVAAAPAAAQKPQAVPAPAPTLQPSIDAAIWQGEATTGPVVHRESGISLPEAFGNLRRIRAGGLSSTDAFANYRYSRNGRESVVTVFLFRPGALPEHRLPVAVAAIGVRSPQAFLWTDGPFLIGSTPELRAYKATFKTGIGPNTVMDYLYFAPLGRWTVKVRATVVSPTDIEHERDIDAFVRGLPWTEILRAAGTCNGWACDTQRAFPFNSHTRELMPDLPAAPAQPVYRQGDYRLVPYPEGRLAEFLTRTFGAISVREPVYAIETTDGARRRILRFYSGLPTEEQFRRAVRALRQHPEPPAMVPPSTVAYQLDAFE